MQLLASGIACSLFLQSHSIAAPYSSEEEKAANRPVQNKVNVCNGSQDHNSSYPYNVQSLISRYSWVRRTSQIGESPNISVLIVDNGFIGFDGSDNSRIPTSAYPQRFFRTIDSVYMPLAINSLKLSLPDDDVLPDLSLVGHGTHISGILLGGSYGNKTNGGWSPSVRNVFRNGAESEDRDWISVFVLGIGDEQLNITKDLNWIESALEGEGKNYRVPDIVNLSLIKVFSTFQKSNVNELPEGKDTLFVTAAGNLGHDISNGRLIYLPAGAQKANMLVVASHDADGAVSSFSNFGSRYVNIAAPGCNILSWPTGDEKNVVPLSGTSMATAVVSFGAGLVKSVWERADGNMLASRIIASSSFNQDILNCKGLSPTNRNILTSNSPTRNINLENWANSACIRFGSQLDIETAILVDWDYLEWCPIESQVKGGKSRMEGPELGTKFEKCLEPQRAVGKLYKVPNDILANCALRSNVVGKDDISRGAGLGPSAAVKGFLSEKGEWTLLVMTHEGDNNNWAEAPHRGYLCYVSQIPDNEYFEFSVHHRFDIKSDGGKDSKWQRPTEKVQPSQIIRIVTSSRKEPE